MKRIARLILVPALFLLSLPLKTLAQTDPDLTFLGLLTDRDGNSLGKETLHVRLQLYPKTSQTPLFASERDAVTDENGWFQLLVEDLLSCGDGTDFPREITLDLTLVGTKKTTFLAEGEEFQLRYSLVFQGGSENQNPFITRLDGVRLTEHAESELFVCKDEYPFGWVTGGFVWTDRSTVRKQAVKDLQEWIRPQTEGDGVNRGLKGGFPGGSYKKQN
ncbi:MAG: hypothetical protein R2751_02500 [Bacteroidales bacterium]